MHETKLSTILQPDINFKGTSLNVDERPNMRVDRKHQNSFFSKIEKYHLAPSSTNGTTSLHLEYSETKHTYM